MKQVLNVYEIELTVAGPVFIGSGREIGKKEYALSQRQDTIAVLDSVKLFQLLEKKKLIEAYSNFVLGRSRDDIGMWFQRNRISEAEYMACAKYRLNCDKNVKRELSKLSIMEFVRDAYGMPYVPGSSLKGMLRTILLAYDINNNERKYCEVRDGIKRGLNGRPSRNAYKKEAKSMEDSCFHTVGRPKTKMSDAVNDIMSGVVIGDSEPLTNEDLVLCRRIELRPDGMERKLNVLRETLKPGVSIKFQMTIDSSISRLDKSYIQKAIEYFGKMYYNNFLRKFVGMDIPATDMVWLGGSTGFVAKTEIYPLFGSKDGVEITADIFRLTKVPKDHKHVQDKKMNVSPHICKVADCNGKRCHMGACHFKIS